MNAFSLPFRQGVAMQALVDGDRARRARDWAAAATYYRRYLKTRPNHFAIWVQLGHALRESAQYADAEAAYHRALALDEHNSDLLLNLGHLHKRMGLVDLAADFYHRSANEDGNAHAIRELRILGLSPPPRPRAPRLDGGGVQRLVAKCKARLKTLSSGERKRLRELADGARDLGQWAEAADLYQRYLRFRPDDFPIWVQLGHALKESHRCGDALVAYRRALALNARDADLLLNIGHLYNVVGDWERSSEFYRASAAVADGGPSPAGLGRPAAPEGTKSDRAAGDAARDRGDWLVAAEHYRRYLQIQPRDLAIWVQLGHALKESGRMFDAEVAYGEARFLAPRDPDLLLSLGHLHNLRGDREQAIDFYSRSLAEDGNEHARTELRSLGATTGIAPDYKSLAKRDIGGILAAIRSCFWGKRRRVLRLANQARDRLDWPAAALGYRRYLRARPDHFAIWVQLGHALKENGQLDEALGAYGQALSLDGHDADLLLSLGRIHSMMGHFDSAADLFRRSALQDGNQHALNELNRLPISNDRS